MRLLCHRRLLLALFCGSIALAGVCFFLLKVQFDNKYASWPQAQEGMLTLGQTHADLLFLWNGWEFYPGICLTPEEIAQAAPDYMFIGELAGFRRDELAGTSGGSATYRLTIKIQTAQEFALEVPYVFGDYRLWINGQLRRSSLDGGPPYLTMEPVNGRVEIVIAVRAQGQLYDGLVYPPAFGSPASVWTLLQLHGLAATALCGCALFLGSLYLMVGLRTGRHRLALSFALLCLCYAVSVFRTPLLTIGLSGHVVLIVCRVCYYGIFLALMSIFVEILNLTLWVRRTALTVGTIMCLWVLCIQCFGQYWGTAALRLFGATVQWYKYAVALFLICAPISSALRNRPHVLPLLSGGLFFAAALLVDRLYPGYEPALVQWPVETAAMVQIDVIAWILVSSAVRISGDNLLLGEQKRAAQVLADAQAKQYTALAQHFDAFSRVRHDMRSLLIALRRKCELGEYEGMVSLIGESLGATEHRTLTENSLVNAILSVLLQEAQEAGIRVETRFGPLPAVLAIEDTDLCILLSNLIRNAIEAAAQAGSTIELHLRHEDQSLYFVCTNSFTGDLHYQHGRLVTKKWERGHGLGLSTVGEIVERYCGVMTLIPSAKVFRASVSIPC